MTFDHADMRRSDPAPIPKGVALLRLVLTGHWSHDTSYRASGDWTPTNPSFGQCAITALKVQELLGGELLRVDMPRIGSHYANRINGAIVDLTAEQFAEPIDYVGAQVRERQQVLSNANTAARYRAFSRVVDADLDAVLPLADTEHVAIRDARYVAGTGERPEVGVFVQTRTRPPAINVAKLAVGQRVWMKWNSGPIVAVSELLSWHAGEFTAANVNDVRDRCIGTSLFGLDAYWKAVASKEAGAYCVLRLTNEAWLDSPVWPATRSYGSSWVYLDTLRKKVQWLAFGSAPPREVQEGRSIPAGLRFKVLRRNGFTCQYCGRKAPEVELHVDHRVPWSKVKTHDIDNLVTACRDCNLGKGATRAAAHDLGTDSG
jgi:hypothetical protein